MNNKKIGTDFERRVLKTLKDKGYWVHFMIPDATGKQPFDIIAVKDGMAAAIECKTLSENQKWFNIGRLEENQIMAFEKWIACGNPDPIIAVLYKDTVLLLQYAQLKAERKINMQALLEYERMFE